MPKVGIREGEKLHEVMVTREDSMNTYEYEKHFIVYHTWTGGMNQKFSRVVKRLNKGLNIVQELIQSGCP